MYKCPKCSIPLNRNSSPFGIFWSCPKCSGRAVSIHVLHKILPQNIINKIWQRAQSDEYEKFRKCPICRKYIPEVPIINDENTVCLDVCTKCYFVWFDGSEYESLPKVEIPKPKEKEQLTLEARKALALWQLECMKSTISIAGISEGEPPEHLHQQILGFLGLPIENNNYTLKYQPFVTWLIGVAMVIVTIFALSDLEYAVNTFGLIPAEFARGFGLTFFSSFFLHAGLLHLISNLYFLMVFGDNVEDVLGKPQYIFLIILAALVGDFFHIICDPNKLIPCVGASAGISGILVYYCLRFPDASFSIFYFFYFIRYGWLTIKVKTFIALWIFIQVLTALKQTAGLSDVSAFAHLGGVSVGFLFWLSEKRVLSKRTAKTA